MVVKGLLLDLCWSYEPVLPDSACWLALFLLSGEHENAILPPVRSRPGVEHDRPTTAVLRPGALGLVVDGTMNQKSLTLLIRLLVAALSLSGYALLMALLG